MENSISSDLIRGHIDTIILRTISKTDKNSQEIMDEILDKSDGKYELKQATLYSSLKRLETEKFISSYWHDSPEGGRRKLFHLTEKGQSLMRRNLSDWVFSRAIIDTLVDSDSVSITREQYNSSLAEKKSNENTSVVEKIVYVDRPVEVEKIVEVEKVVEVEKIIEKKVEVPVDRKDVKIVDEVTQELNFRQILNGLICTSNLSKSNDTEGEIDVKPIEKPNDKQIEFNKEIYKRNSAKEGKSDFSDVIDECERENIKVRISKKHTSISKAGIKINLITAISAVMILGLMVLEWVLISQLFKGVLSSGVWIALYCAIFIFPAIMVIRCAKNPHKVAYRYLAIKNVLLTSFIVIFDIALLNIAVIFLAGIDMSVKFNLLVWLVLPVCFYVNSFLYFVIRSVFVSSDAFKVVKSK